MSANINLISGEGREDPKKARLKKLKNFSFILLFAVGFLALLFLLINYRFSVNYVRGQQQDLIKKISIYDETALKIVLLNSRLSDISFLLKERQQYNKIGTEVSKGLSSSITVEEVNISNGGISLKLSSTSLLPLNEFLNKLLKMRESNLIKSVSIEELSIEASLYSLKINAQ